MKKRTKEIPNWFKKLHGRHYKGALDILKNEKHRCPACSEDDNNQLETWTGEFQGSYFWFKCEKCGFEEMW